MPRTSTPNETSSVARIVCGASIVRRILQWCGQLKIKCRHTGTEIIRMLDARLHGKAQFRHFWSNFREGEDRAADRFLFSTLEEHPLVIGSVFGRSRKTVDVLYSGECIRDLCYRDGCFIWANRWGAGKARWFFGIPRIDHPRAFWQPHFYHKWAMYRDQRYAELPMLRQAEKEFGISVVMSNFRLGDLAHRRFAIAHALSQFVPVHANRAMSIGAPADSRVIYHDIPFGYKHKLRFLSSYTHNLCFENESFPGYLTEKLFDALYAGVVPLYAGDPLAGEWFEEGSYVDCIALEAEEIGAIVRSDSGMMENVSQRRDALCRVSFEEMEERTKKFHRQILAERNLA